MPLTWDENEDDIIVTEEEIAQVEEKLNVKFPTSYKEILKYHSGDFSEELEEMIELEEIINMEDIPGYCCISYMSTEQLSKVIPIFHSASGNYYALDYNVLNENNEPTIIDIDHELDEGTVDDIPRYNSFEELIK